MFSGAAKGMGRLSFMAAVLFTHVACGPDAEMLKETAREPNATLRFSNFRHTYYKGLGTLKWDVRGDEVFIYQKGDDTQRIVAYGFAMKQADPKDPVEVAAKRGELNYEKKTLTMEGDCSLKDNKGILHCSRLVYDLEKKVATSDEPVLIERAGSRTNCVGGVVFERLSDRMTCRGPRGSVVPAQRDKKGEQKTAPVEDLFQ